MKRLLTYGLLLLTILASHFVVSACQDDSDKTTIVMTFTTRIDNTPQSTTPGEEAEVEVEQMKELRIIMAREDGTVIVNAEDYNVEVNPYSFSFNVPMMTYTERFQFIVIANESTLVSSDGTAIDLASIDDKDEFNNLKTCVIGQDGFSLGASQYIPQTIYWTQEITYGETTNIKKVLLFVVGKITVEFENQTEDAQSLSDIHIKGIIPNAQGYLLAQASNDFVGTQHDASAMQASDILFSPVTVPSDNSSPIQHYYTYPVGTGGIASANLPFTQSDKQYMQPTLFATWNGIEYNLPITEVTDEEGKVHPFTSLARNERLKIVITLTPAGDITVNYTIAAWEETPTNIGKPQPNPGGGYHVDTWGTGGIIDVGGGGGLSWDNLGGSLIPEGTVSVFDEIPGEPWDSNYFNLKWNVQDFPSDKVVAGNTVIIRFKRPDTEDAETLNISLIPGDGVGVLVEPFEYPGDQVITIRYRLAETNNGISISTLQTQGIVIQCTNANIKILGVAIATPNPK